MKQGDLFAEETGRLYPVQEAAINRMPVLSPLRAYRRDLKLQVLRDCYVMEEIESGEFLTDIPEFFEGRIASYSEAIAELDRRIAVEEPT